MADSECEPTEGPVDFDVFFRSEYRAAVGFAYALSGSRHAAEDLAQEAFLAAHRHWGHVGAYERPGAWVRLVIANTCRSRWRRALAEGRARLRVQRERALPSELPEADGEFWAALRALPAMQAKCLALRYYDDLAVADIAGLLGCAPATVRVHLHRGRERLANTLGCPPPEEER